MKENELDVSDNQDKILEEIKDISQSHKFYKNDKPTSTSISINELQSFKVWEDCKEGAKQCKLAILGMRTAEQGFLAKSLIKANIIVLR